jgi:PAS domain S-box-containing protein
VPYLVIGADGTIDSANLAAIRLFGVSEEWFHGKNIFNYIKSDDEHQSSLVFEYFKQRISVDAEELIITRPDQKERWVLLSLFSFTDTNNKHKGLLTLVDVTKQKEIDRTKTEFVSLASHQLRTPISAMKWNMELLENIASEHLTETDREYLSKVNHGVARMEDLVSDFLSVSKLELGTFVPTIENIPIPAFMESILESHQKLAELHNITIERVWNEYDVIRADTHLLEMAVSNLVSNAVKYTIDSGVVRVSFGVEERHYSIAVSDTGIGIPEDEQSKIFSKIFRATNAKAEVPDGTGLGLYIVREAIRVMGGEVTFTSRVGEGTTFTIILPS